MKIGSRIVIEKDDAAGASAVRKPPEDRREEVVTLTLAAKIHFSNRYIALKACFETAFDINVCEELTKTLA
jgi:hypothetical protein